MLGAQKAQVNVSKSADLTWQVWLGERVVGSFAMVGDALAYASILECNPRVRNEAISA